MGIFSELPRHNQMDVLKKLEFQDFVKFRKCSQKSMEMTRHFEHKLYLEMEYIDFFDDFDFYRNDVKYGFEIFSGEPIRLNIEMFRINVKMPDEKYCIFEDFSQKTKLEVKEMNLCASTKEDRNDAAIIDNLIKLLKVDTLLFEHYSSSVFSSLNELKNITQISFEFGEMTECDFHLLTQPSINIIGMTNALTPPAIATFLKQWLEKKREIEHLSADIEGNFMEACKDLKISILWSPVSPEGNIRFQNEEGEITLLQIYSVEREMDKKKIFILIWDGDVQEDSRLKRIDIEEYEEMEDIQEYIRSTFDVEDYCLPCLM